MEIHCSECLSYLANDIEIGRNQGKIKWVLLINFFMMIGEIVAGYSSGSIALMAEGWHMGSHVGALLITLLAYRLAKSIRVGKSLSFGAGKLIPLGGYTSAVSLGIVAFLILVESVERLVSPVEISFSGALLVAALGLVVNVTSALILQSGHDHEREHGHDVHDHNIRSAFLHIMADALTSVLAIAALSLGLLFHWNFLDPVIGIVGALVIFVWSFQLCRDTGWELLDGHSKALDWRKLKQRLEGDGATILDFHVWRIAPQAIACELVVHNAEPRGLEHYRSILRNEFSVQHIVVEERTALAG